MNNLTTRKIVLGLLMTLVLTFSVQGIADAFTVTESSASDEFILVKSTGTALNLTFTFPITFTSTEVSRGSLTDSETDDVVNVSVSSTGSGVTITSFTVGSLTDEETTENAGSAMVDPTSTSYTATVGYTLSQGDTGLGIKPFIVGGVPVYRGYGVRDESQNTFSTLIPGTTSPQTGAESSSKPIMVTTSASWTKVTFSTTSGLLYSSGTANYYYVQGTKLQRTLPSGSTTITAYPDSNSSNVVAVQYRATGNTTATVTAGIPGSVNRASTHKVTVFFNSSVSLERISGNEQFGQMNSSTLDVANRPQLINPLVVRVLDGTRGVGEKQGKVKFTVTSGGGALRYFSSSLFDPATGSTQNTNSVTVYTDGQGDAKAYLVLGTSAGAHMVTAGVVGVSGVSETFIATATPAVLGGQNLKIDRDANRTTQTPQRNAQYGNVNTPLTMSVKIVANAGDSTPSDVNNVQVNFQINGGRIYLAPATLDLTQPDYQTSLTTVTETVDRANGVATVYVEVNNGATATVTAQIVGNNTSRGRHVVTYFWGDPNYDDGGGTSEPSRPATNTITISPSSTTGEPGEEVTIRVTSSPSGVFATLGSNDFGATRFSPQSDVTPFTSTLLLPVEEGTHSFFATGGVLTAGSASVTVEAELGTLSITAIGTRGIGCANL